MKQTDLAGRDLSGHDLRGADLSRKVLFGTDLRGARLHGCTISIDCDTFDGVKLDDRQVAMFLALLAQADTGHQAELWALAHRIHGEGVREWLKLI